MALTSRGSRPGEMMDSSGGVIPLNSGPASPPISAAVDSRTGMSSSSEKGPLGDAKYAIANDLLEPVLHVQTNQANAITSSLLKKFEPFLTLACLHKARYK